MFLKNTPIFLWARYGAAQEAYYPPVLKLGRQLHANEACQEPSADLIRTRRTDRNDFLELVFPHFFFIAYSFFDLFPASVCLF
jgi:hypothetical protein